MFAEKYKQGSDSNPDFLPFFSTEQPNHYTVIIIITNFTYFVDKTTSFYQIWKISTFLENIVRKLCYFVILCYFFVILFLRIKIFSLQNENGEHFDKKKSRNIQTMTKISTCSQNFYQNFTKILQKFLRKFYQNFYENSTKISTKILPKFLQKFYQNFYQHFYQNSTKISIKMST